MKANLVQQIEIRLKGEANRHSTALAKVQAVRNAVEELAAVHGELVYGGPERFDYYVDCAVGRRKLISCFVSRYNLATIEIHPSIGTKIERTNIMYTPIDEIISNLAEEVSNSLSAIGRFTL